MSTETQPSVATQVHGDAEDTVAAPPIVDDDDDTASAEPSLNADIVIHAEPLNGNSLTLLSLK